MKKVYLLFVLFSFLMDIPILLPAQDNYEIQVYGSGLTEKRQTIFELHSNFTLDGSRQTVDHVYPSNHVFHETVEITHGFTKWFEFGSYLFTSVGTDNRTALTGTHLRPRISIPEDFSLPVGISLGAEVGYQNPDFFGSRWAIEIRPIFDNEAGRFYFAVNLPVGRSLDANQEGPPAGGWEFSPSFKSSFDVSEKISLGFEYYAGLGAISNMDPVSQQRHQLFGAVDWAFHPDWEFNAGVGYGLTESTDKWIVKFILGYRIPF